MVASLNSVNNGSKLEKKQINNSSYVPYYLTKKTDSVELSKNIKTEKNTIGDVVKRFFDIALKLFKKSNKTQFAKTEAQPKVRNIREILNELGFTKDGIEDLKELSSKFGPGIVKDSIAIAKILNNMEEEGIAVTYRHLNRAIEKVRPDALASTQSVLEKVIINDWKHGEQIRADFYSELPPGLADEMRNWNNGK